MIIFALTIPRKPLIQAQLVGLFFAQNFPCVLR
jgi:hypothetical protein